jgi:predicted transglutaminase-like cysteine proteinase
MHKITARGVEMRRRKRLTGCLLLFSAAFLAAASAAANPPTGEPPNADAAAPATRSADAIIFRLFPSWADARDYLVQGHPSADIGMRELTRWAAGLRPLPAAERLKAINERVNGLVSYASDSSLWQRSDYWETPGETLRRGAADCEGYAILKMYLAKAAGLPLDRMAVLVGDLSNQREPHALLGVKAGSTILTLDNRSDAVLTLEDRWDFSPLYFVGTQGGHIYPRNWDAAFEPSDTPPAFPAGQPAAAAVFDLPLPPLKPAMVAAGPDLPIPPVKPAAATATAAFDLPLPPHKPVAAVADAGSPPESKAKRARFLGNGDLERIATFVLQ